VLGDLRQQRHSGAPITLSKPITLAGPGVVTIAP